MDWNEWEQKLDRAFKLRNNAGFLYNKTEDLLEAADLFKKSIIGYDKLIGYWKSISERKMELARINKEHIIYERYFCLYIYHYRLGNINLAIKNLELSDKHLYFALKSIFRITNNINEKHIEELKFDEKTWKYFRLQNKVLYQSLLAEKAIDESNISLSLDYYKIAKDESKKLIEVTKDYIDVLDINYERIVLSNYYKASSNYSIKLAEIQGMSGNNQSFYPIITESIIHIWEAYKYSLESIKIFPENDQHRDVLREQFDLITYLLKNNKKSWAIFLTKIKDEDFNILLRQIDKKTYKKTIADISNNIDFYEVILTKILRIFNIRTIRKETYEDAKNRIEYLKEFIERNDGYRLFYKDDYLIGDEDTLQLMFRLTWYATDTDVNREVNNGRGSVDYKISKGAFDSTLVEFKLAKNSKLKQNLKNQIGIYEKANNTKQSFKVIMYFTKEEYERVKNILEDLELTYDKSIYLIDARKDNKISASNVK
jgi:hypothetical protein